jgi:hypothetical protein
VPRQQGQAAGTCLLSVATGCFSKQQDILGPKIWEEGRGCHEALGNRVKGVSECPFHNHEGDVQLPSAAQVGSKLWERVSPAGC